MIEVLSPAGNIAALKSAVANRADAVYLGLENFNARLKADNFSTHNIKEWVDFCHLYNVKVYVTINTLIKQSELQLLDTLLLACESAKVDAIIVTDLAVVAKAKKLCPSVALHASTQMGIHNYLGAKFLEEIGFSRVVLARECTIADIKEIKKYTNLEIEYFVHGAMCVAFSGQCLLSSIASGNSGNRGLCLQLCRKEYKESLTGSKCYAISAKDQCLIENIKQLVEAGVTSLKIEGRLKSAEYVGLITSKYRKAVDGIEITTNDISEMKRAFNRGGYSNGYSFSQKNDLLYTKVQNHMGQFIGEIEEACKFKDNFKLELKTKFALKNGDGIKIFRDDREVGGFEVSIIEKNSNGYKLFSRNAFCRGDKVHITLDSTLTEKFSNDVMPKILLEIDCKISQKNVIVNAMYKKQNITYTENVNFELAKNLATDSMEIKKQFSKTGNTPFEFEIKSVQMQENLFVPKSVINNIRRNFVQFLESEIIEINRQNWQNELLANKAKPEKCTSDFLQKYDVISPENSDIVICEKLDLDSKNCESIMKIAVNYNNFDKSIINYAKNHNNIFIKLPKIAMSADLKIILKKLEELPKNVGIYADNFYAYYLAVISKRAVIGGMGLNLFNRDSIKFLGLKSFVVSSELSKSEIEEIGLPSAVFAFGYLPVMNFCHCPVQHFTGCSCDNCKYKEYSLSDKYGDFKVKRSKIANCYFEMLNNSCHFIEKNELNGNFACIDVCNFENPDEIVSNYDNNSCFIFNNNVKLTKGQFLRGVK